MLEKVSKQKLVVIGNGMAGIRALEDAARARAGPLRRHDLQRRAARQLRPHHAVAGAGRREDLRRHHHQRAMHWYVDNGITLYRARRSRRSTAHARGRHRGAARVVPYDRLLIATGSDPFILPVPGNDLAGRRHLPRPRRRQRACSTAATSRRQRRRHRRRPARPRGRRRPDEARHGRHRPASDADADGAPARSGRRLPAAARRSKSAASSVHCKAQTKAILGERQASTACGLADGRDLPGRSRRHGGRHPPERRARQGRRARGQPRHRRRRRACAPPTPTSSRSANAPSIGGQCYGLVAPLYEHGASVCADASRRRGTATLSTARCVSTKLKVTGIDLFSRRRLRRRRRTARRSCCATPRAASTSGSS